MDFAMAKNTVLMSSKSIPNNMEEVTGYEWNNGVDYRKLIESYKRSGFQATNVGLAIDEVRKMIECRKQPLTKDKMDESEADPFIKRKNNCTIYLGYTSNLVSCGLRETIRFLVEHKLIDCIVTTAGGIEEDFIKCLAPTYIGDFNLDGNSLRQSGINRIGNLVIPNNNYVLFENWLMPIFDKMLEEQKNDGIVWSPSKVIERLGKEINHKSSIYYWAAKNHIPVFCPAITDGSIGDMIFFHAHKNPELIIDVASDIIRMNTMTLKAENTGIIILGGGIIKHHICNSNSMRNGANFSVFVNSNQEFDGSDSGARPDEAKSWGKIKQEAKPVKIYADASIVFPLIVSETFVRSVNV